MKKTLKLFVIAVLGLTHGVQQGTAGTHVNKRNAKVEILQDEILVRTEKDFLGSPQFIVKDRANLSKCVSWDAFSAHYKNRLQPFNRTFHILPHYSDGKCLWHALGISVSDTYDLIIESAKEILEQKKLVQSVWEEFQRKDVQRKSQIFHQGETEDEKRERKENEEMLGSTESFLRETFDALFPGQFGDNDSERVKVISELLENRKAQDENKKAWIELTKKNGGKTFSFQHTMIAVRPLHNPFFFQKVADHLGVVTHIFYEEQETIYFPTGISSQKDVPTLYLHGTDYHYEPVVKEGQPVSLALIRDMENFLNSKNPLKVTKENYIKLSFEPAEKEEKKETKISQISEKVEKQHEEKKNTQHLEKVEQEKKDDDVAKSIQQQEEDEILAKTLQKEEDEKALQEEEDKRLAEKVLQEEEDAKLAQKMAFDEYKNT